MQWKKIDNKIKYEGELDLNGLKIPCYVLEDGRRVLSTISKLDCVNFIEMTEGYLNKTCTFVSN